MAWTRAVRRGWTQGRLREVFWRVSQPTLGVVGVEARDSSPRHPDFWLRSWETELPFPDNVDEEQASG